MQLKVFVLPIKNLCAAEAEMNGFLRGHRVLAVKKEFVADGESSCWSFCVDYLDGGGAGAVLPGARPKVDDTEVLTHYEKPALTTRQDERGCRKASSFHG